MESNVFNEKPFKKSTANAFQHSRAVSGLIKNMR